MPSCNCVWLWYLIFVFAKTTLIGHNKPFLNDSLTIFTYLFLVDFKLFRDLQKSCNRQVFRSNIGYISIVWSFSGHCNKPNPDNIRQTTHLPTFTKCYDYLCMWNWDLEWKTLCENVFMRGILVKICLLKPITIQTTKKDGCRKSMSIF